MKEWQRTVLLILLIVLAIGYIFWTRQQVDTNFTDTLRSP
jgi:hypothetical protein